ncbi:MAG: hypothetical protein ABI855_02240 [Bacteroidota bacterium]
MIVKGTAIKSKTHASYLANHLLNAKDNDVCEVWDIDCHAKPNDLKTALVDYYEMVQLTKGGKTGLFMISLNPEPGEQMNDEHFYKAISKAEKTFNLEGQPKAIVRHFKHGRNHIHVVWQTTDVENRRNKAELFYYQKKCVNLARELEIELGHKPVSNEKSNSSFNEKERGQEKRQAKELKPTERKKLIQKIFDNVKNSSDFVLKMKEQRYIVGQGKVGLCLIDDNGQVFNLEKEIKGKTTQKELKDYFKNYPDKLPDATRTSIEKKSKEKALKKELEKKSSNEISDSQKRAYYLIYDHKYREQQKASKEIVVDNKTTRQQKTLAEIDKIKEQQKDSKQQTFRERLEQAQQNMREENENDLSHEQERRNKLFDQFKKNNLDLILIPLGIAIEVLKNFLDY